jgi:hypothetical protein
MSSGTNRAGMVVSYSLSCRVNNHSKYERLHWNFEGFKGTMALSYIEGDIRPMLGASISPIGCVAATAVFCHAVSQDRSPKREHQ